LSSLLAVASPTLAADPNPDAAQTALDWLRTQQQPDGAFAGFSGASDPGTTADVLFAFEAAGVAPASVASSTGTTPLDYLNSQAAAIATNPGLAAKVALALDAAGVDPHDAGGNDLVASVTSGFDVTSGRYDQSFYGHLIAIMALETLGSPVEQAAYTAILDAQQDDGSWNFNGDTTPNTGDSNTTAMAIMVLAHNSAGQGQDAAKAGIDYLLTLQADDGAVGYDAASVSTGGDANSTALAVQAMLAVGSDPATTPKGDLLAALTRFQNPSGAFQFQPSMPDDSLLATAQAVPALLLKPLPIQPATTSASPADAVQPAVAQAGCEFFDITRHNVCSPFLTWWQARGGVANFGYPLSEATTMDGMTVQYFERARFEHHPEFAGTVWEVELTRFGADAIERDHAAEASPVGPKADCLRFEITGHNVCDRFAAFWEENGGLPVFGYPMSEPFEDNGMTVQYFERARFEYQPGVWPQRSDVLLGRLAAEVVDRALAQ
jgi:hypothetical protein